MNRYARPILAALLAALWLGQSIASALPCPADCDRDGTVTHDELLAAITLAVTDDSAAGCAAADRDADDRVAIDDIIATQHDMAHGCTPLRQAMVIATDFQTGAYGTVQLDAPRSVLPATGQRRTGGDAVVRHQGGLVYVINRFLADNLQVLDPGAGLALRYQCSTGSGTNPHDVVVVAPDKAYVTAYERSELLIIHPAPRPDCSDFVRGRIDLAAHADADGIPEMDQMALVDGRLYVGLQRLDRRNFFAPAMNGAVAIIDTERDTVSALIELHGANPFASTKGLVVDGNSLLIGQAGQIGTLDGGLERIDLGDLGSSGFLITEQELGGDLTDFVWVSPALAFAVIESNARNRVVAFDPRTRQILYTLHAGGFVSDIEANDRGELFVADRSFGNAGVRIYRLATGAELTTAPLALGLPPFDILFLP